MSSELIGIMTVGVAIAALQMLIIKSLRADMYKLSAALGQRVGAMEQCLAKLEEMVEACSTAAPKSKQPSTLIGIARETLLADCYRHHGGSHRVAIVHCPEIFGNRLGHLSQDGNPDSWALRDFVTRQIIRNSPSSNHASSSHTLAQIEATVTYCEPPPFHSIEHVQDWELYLRLRSYAVLGTLHCGDPNPAFGDWKDLP